MCNRIGLHALDFPHPRRQIGDFLPDGLWFARVNGKTQRMGRLIAISNRTATQSANRAGGLAVAVWESLKSTGGVWAGWSGEISPGEPDGPRTLSDEGVEFLLTDLSQDEHDAYYLGYANSVLWPVFHYRVDLATFDAEAFKVYAAVNQRIATPRPPLVPHEAYLLA